MHTDPSPARPLERRQFIRVAGAAGFGALLARFAAAEPLAPQGLSWPAATCALTPSGAEGPFYLQLDLLREDITEGRPGFDLELYLRVVRASDCSPVAGAIVDVWHANALGRYSGVAAHGTAGQTFLRGIQVTGASGVVHFHTIFPGWYLGRATHAHAKVRPAAGGTFTTQLFFPPSIERALLSQPIYGPRGASPFTHANDPWFVPGNVVPTRAVRCDGPLAVGGSRRLTASFTLSIP